MTSILRNILCSKPPKEQNLGWTYSALSEIVNMKKVDNELVDAILEKV